MNKSCSEAALRFGRILALATAFLFAFAPHSSCSAGPTNAEIDQAFRIFLNVKEHILLRCIYRPSEMDILRGAQKELAKELGPDFAGYFFPLTGGDFTEAFQSFQRSLLKVAAAPGMKLTIKNLVEHSLRGYCRTLDRYCEYDDRETWNIELKLKQADYSGVGMTIARTATSFECYPFPGTPADLAGADPGDRVLEVDGVSVRGRTLVEVGAMFVGKVGGKVQFKVEHCRNGKVETLIATREKIRASLIDVETNGKAATVRLRRLNDSTVQDLRTFLQTFAAGGALTLDLRGCIGGDLSAALAVARMFLPSGAVIAQVETLAGKEVFTSENRTPYRASKLVILQDRGTASGAELITLALVTSPEVHAESRGEKTYGKGVTISEDNIEGGGGRLRITDARIYGPHNEFWDLEGLPPGVEVESPVKVK